jgi:hypothetical protein
MNLSKINSAAFAAALPPSSARASHYALSAENRKALKPAFASLFYGPARRSFA